MTIDSRTVYRFRYWKRLVKSCLWILFGPLWAVLLVASSGPSASHRLWGDPLTQWLTWVFHWVAVFYVLERICTESYAIFSYINERVVVEGSRLDYYTPLGRKKISLDIKQIQDIEKIYSGEWRVFTPQGRFSFTRQLQGYQDLLARFEQAGKTVNPLPRL